MRFGQIRKGRRRFRTSGILFIALVFLVSCGSGSLPKLDPESQNFYDLAGMIMTREESKMFKLLPDAESRKEFIKDFWEKRDPFPETPENEFLQEFMSRVNHADLRFREGGRGRDTDRGRIYIFLGPPDKIDEVFTHYDPTVRGSIITWIYYNYNLGIEFVDERGTGKYTIREISGNLFEAMDIMKLGGRFGPDSVFKDRIVRFNIDYDYKNKKLVVVLPAKSLNFSEDEQGFNFVSLRFVFYLYNRQGQKVGKFAEDRIYRVNLQDYVDLKEVVFEFELDLPEGKGYIDVTVEGRGEKGGRIRKLFEVK